MGKSKESRVTIIPAQIETTAPEEIESKRLRVAAYCRVSTNSEEQLSSYEAQLEYYMTKVMQNPQWSLVKVYADQGITGTSTKKRKEFQKMIRACKDGKVYYHLKNFLGYREGPDGKPEIEPEEAEIVKRIFNPYLRGDSIAKIQKQVCPEREDFLCQVPWYIPQDLMETARRGQGDLAVLDTNVVWRGLRFRGDKKRVCGCAKRTIQLATCSSGYVNHALLRFIILSPNF